MFDDCGRCEDDAAPVYRPAGRVTFDDVPPHHDSYAVAGLVRGARDSPPVVNSLDALLSRLTSVDDDDFF